MDASTTPKAATVMLLIGGQFVESKTTQWRNVVNPATQQVLARVPFATAEEINAAVASAKEAFKTWKKTPIGARARIFLKLQQLIRENMGELAAMLTAEQGKTLPDAEGDVFRGLEVVEHAASIGNLQLGELANNVAGGVFDHFEATEHIAFGVGQGLALFGGQHGGQFAHIFTDELLELQEDAGACADGGLLPGLESFLGRGHGSVDFFSGGKRHTGQHLLRGGVDHVAPFGGLGFDELAADQQLDGGGLDGGGCIHGFCLLNKTGRQHCRLHAW